MSARSRIRPLAAWGLVAALALALAVYTGHARDRLRASQQLRVAEVIGARLAAAGRPAPRAAAANLRLLRQARELDPGAVGPAMALGSQYMLIGRPRAALDTYEEALALEPRPEIYLNMGLAYRALGRRPEAEGAFRDALRLDPGLETHVPAGFR